MSAADLLINAVADPARIRETGRHIAAQADRLRDATGALTAHLEAVRWHSRGGEAFRHAGHELLSRSRSATGELDALASALARHALLVEEHAHRLSAAARLAEQVTRSVTPLWGLP